MDSGKISLHDSMEEGEARSNDGVSRAVNTQQVISSGKDAESAIDHKEFPTTHGAAIDSSSLVHELGPETPQMILVMCPILNK